MQVHDALELQRDTDPDTESPKHLAARAAPPATLDTSAFTVVAPEAKKVGREIHRVQENITHRSCRWPLVFRFIKGAIHAQILLPVFLHAVFTAFVVYLDTYVFDTVGLPTSIVQELSNLRPKLALIDMSLDPFTVHSCGFDACFQESDLIQ